MGAGVGDMRIYVKIWLDAFVRSFAVLTTCRWKWRNLYYLLLLLLLLFLLMILWRFRSYYGNL